MIMINRKVTDEELAKRTLDFEERPKELRTFHKRLPKEFFKGGIELMEETFEEEFADDEIVEIYQSVKHLTPKQWSRVSSNAFEKLRTEYGLPTVYWFIAEAEEAVKQPTIHIPEELTNGRQKNISPADY